MAIKLLLVILIVVGFIFLPTTVFMIFGMLPTIAVFATDRTVGRNKTICIGAMNFAGCFPFLLEFWMEFGQQTVDNALRLIGQSETIIVIYMLALGGYAINKAVTGITVSIIIQRNERRLKKINSEQEKLVKRWGEKVTGQYALDDYGFPVKPIPEKKKEKGGKDAKKNQDIDNPEEDDKSESKQPDDESSK
jgi:hypothetical protein